MATLRYGYRDGAAARAGHPGITEATLAGRATTLLKCWESRCSLMPMSERKHPVRRSPQGVPGTTAPELSRVFRRAAPRYLPAVSERLVYVHKNVTDQNDAAGLLHG